MRTLIDAIADLSTAVSALEAAAQAMPKPVDETAAVAAIDALSARVIATSAALPK